jgi:hypothetical protein
LQEFKHTKRHHFQMPLSTQGKYLYFTLQVVDFGFSDATGGCGFVSRGLQLVQSALHSMSGGGEHFSIGIESPNGHPVGSSLQAPSPIGYEPSGQV